MSFYCKACGALMRDDNKYCENCGTAVVQTEKKTCPNCGTICSEGARFCRICRSPLEMKTSSVVKRKSPAMTIIASVLVLALILGSVSIGINKCNNEIKDDDIKLTNITYSEKDLKAAGNITVDLGAFNLYGESTLEVKTLPEKSDSRTGLTVQAYDFSLSDNTSGEMLSEFPTLVDIMIPCTASADEYAFIQYYDKETQEWHVIDSQRDYENNTLTFQTTHFSIYGESKMILGSEYNFDPDENTVIPSQSFAYIGGYDGPLTEVYFVSADLDKLMDKACRFCSCIR